MSLFLQQDSYVLNFLTVNGVSVSPGARVFFVNNSTSGLPVGAVEGSNGNGGLTPREPFSTLAYALTQTTAGRGDVIVVMPGHAETITTSLAVSTAGTQIIGCKIGNRRPRFTINGATDLFSMSGANTTLQSLDLAIATTDAATAFVDVSAAFVTLRDLYMVPSAAGGLNVVDVITLASGSSDCLIENCEGYNTLTPVNSWISIEAASARVTIRNNLFRGDLVTAGIIDSAAATQLSLRDNVIVTIGTNIPGCVLDSNPTGQAIGNHMYGTDATIANNAQWGTALILGDNFTRGGTGSTVSASDAIPALDT